MSVRNKFWLLTVLSLCLIVTSIDLGIQARAADDESASIGQGVSTGYKFDRQTVAKRTGVAVVDTAATTASDANLATAGEFGAEGRINISVSARFSDSGQTCKVRLVSAWWTTAGTYVVTGVSDEITLAASSLTRGGKYVAPTYVFDSAGARSVFLVVTQAPGAGTVDFWMGSY